MSNYLMNTHCNAYDSIHHDATSYPNLIPIESAPNTPLCHGFSLKLCPCSSQTCVVIRFLNVCSGQCYQLKGSVWLVTYTQLIGSPQQSEVHTVIKVKRTSSLMCEDLPYKSYHLPLSLCVNTETQAHWVMTFWGLFWYTERVQTCNTLLKAKWYALIIHN